MKIRLCALLILVGAIVWCHPAAAESQRDYAQGLLDQQAVVKSAAQITRQTYPEADSVYVDDSTLCEYQPDGTGITWSDSYMKVLTEKGRREKQSLSFLFTQPYLQVTVSRLELIKPDGQIIRMDPTEQSNVMVNRAQMVGNIYNPHSKILCVQVPGLQTDDVVHVVTRHEIQKPLVPDTWSDYQVFESTAPIKHASYEVHAPKERPLHSVALKDPVPGTVTYRQQECNGRTIHRWDVSNVPCFCPEPYMPPSYTVIQRLLVSTLSDWETISRWYWHVCQPHLEATTTEIQTMVEHLTAGVTDPEKRMETLFTWVSRQVRYLGITTDEDAPGWEPHDVEATFANRYGVCRDKAALLVAMLRRAGFDAYPALIDTGPRKDAEVPLTRFNHVIVAVRNGDGSYRLLDCTDEKAKCRLPAHLGNRSYLVAHPQGEKLRLSPVASAEENLACIKTDGDVDASGNLTCITEMTLTGAHDRFYRGYFARIKPEERQQHFESVLKACVAALELQEFVLRPADMQDTAEDLSIRIRFKVDGVLVGDRKIMMLPLPYLGASVGLVDSVCKRAGLAQRRFPLRTECVGVKEDLVLRIDPAVGSFASVPDFEPLVSPAVSWKCSLAQQGHTIETHSEFLIQTAELDAAQYLRLKQILQGVECNRRKMPLLVCSSEGQALAADAIVLDQEVEYRLMDAHRWTERQHMRKKILTEKGVKDHSELKLDYNPVWEEVDLIQAHVTNADQVKEISPNEINVMDAAWVASAPRYPPGKTLVVSMPAVEKGSILDYTYERRKRDRPYFAETHVFRGFDPVRQQTVRLIARSSLPLEIMKDENGTAIPEAGPRLTDLCVIEERKECQEDTVTWQWHMHDQAPVRREMDLPPLCSFNPVLRITAGDWRTFADAARVSLQEAASGQMVAEQRAREITGDKGSVEEKIISIRDFVATQVRAVGPGFHDLPFRTVTAADHTLADGYGNTADRAVLLYAMLAAVGLKPEFVLVNGTDRVADREQFAAGGPRLESFDRVLVRVRSGSAALYLNDTGQYAMLGCTPSDGCTALSLTEGRTETIAVPPDKKDRTECEYRLTLTDTGSARMVMMRKHYGDSCARRRQMFAEMSPQERNCYQEEQIAQFAQTARATIAPGIDFNSYPGRESLSLQIDGYAVRAGDFLYLELPTPISNLLGLRSDRRENPYYQRQTWHMRTSATVELPQEFPSIVYLPRAREWTLPAQGGTITVNVAEQGRCADGPPSIVVTYEVHLNPFLIEAERYASLREMERQLTHARNRVILLTRGQSHGADY